jgi:DNA-directed RNA polymerase specialized sigma24 family protein
VTPSRSARSIRTDKRLARTVAVLGAGHAGAERGADPEGTRSCWRPRRPAFALFYRRHARGALALAARRLAAADADDVIAEAFATALVHWRRCDPARGSAGAWLAGIAQHKIAPGVRASGDRAR